MDFLNAETIAVVLAVIMATQGAAQIIVNSTDTPVDNTWVGRFYKVIEAIAGVLTSKAKQFPGENS